jgi:hypothetical protein
MKKLVLITALFSQILLAQPNDLIVDMNPVAESTVNWETTFTVNGQTGMENGLLIELPSGLKMVPLSARINQTEMYLQNLKETPSIESVICWDFSPEGIILFFGDGQFKTGDQIVLKTMTTLIKKNLKQEASVNIRAVQNINPIIQYSEDIISSANLSLKIKN